MSDVCKSQKLLNFRFKWIQNPFVFFNKSLLNKILLKKGDYVWILVLVIYVKHLG